MIAYEANLMCDGSDDGDCSREPQGRGIIVSEPMATPEEALADAIVMANERGWKKVADLWLCSECLKRKSNPS